MKCSKCGKKVGLMVMLKQPMANMDTVRCAECLESQAEERASRIAARSTAILKEKAEVDGRELSAIEKLQFRKYLAEQGGLSVSEVDDYVASLPDADQQELRIAFRKAQKAGSSAGSSGASAVSGTRKAEETSAIVCPKCKSNQISANKEGFGGTKTAVTTLMTGGVGLLAGLVGMNDVTLTCLKCGHHWKPTAK